MKLIKEKSLPLLKRTRVIYEIEHFKKPTPKKDAVIKELSKEVKKPEDAISLLHIYSHFGRDKSKIIANIYNSKEDKEKFEKINKRKKKELKPEVKKEEKPKVEEKK